MFKILIITVLLLSHNLTTFANASIETKAIEKTTLNKTIDNARWKKRIILLFDDKQHLAQQQLKQWEKVDFDEWDIITIQISADDAQLRQKYQVDENKTISILIGKDGTEKWRSSQLVDFSELEKLIAKMPMRQNEKNVN